MPLVLVDPAEIRIAAVKPNSVYGSQAYHIVESQWDGRAYVNRYRPGCISLEFDQVRDVVESQRVRGKSWVIASIPVLVLEYGTDRFAIIPFNERSSDFYERLLDKCASAGFSHFWEHLPRRNNEWLLVFAIKGEAPKRMFFKPERFSSISQGGGYMLDWDDCPARNEYSPFLAFAGRFLALANFEQSPSAT